MAKKIEAKEEKESSIVLKEIKKKYGDVIKTGTQILKYKQTLKTISISPVLDMNLKGGIKEGTWLMLSGAPKSGKAQPLLSTIYTPLGTTLMKNIKVGDVICSENKRFTKVIGIYPQGVKPVYEVSFSDGSCVRCDLGHLWLVRKNYEHCDVWETKTLEEIQQRMSYSDRDKWCVPVTEIEFYPKEVPIHPYVMGVLLSESTKIDNDVFISNKRLHVFEEVKSILSDYNLTINSDCIVSNKDQRIRGQRANDVIIDNDTNCIDIAIDPIPSNYLNYVLKSLNISNNLKDTRIPSIYMYNSLSCRLNLLRGILSNSGYLKSDYIEYNTANQFLAISLVEMIRTCGILCKLESTDCNHKISIYADNPNDFLGRERKDITRKNKVKTISGIKLINQELCQCIEVDDPSGLYITDGCTVTHNTTTAMQLAYNCQQEGRPVIYANAEGRLSEMNFDVAGLNPEKMQIITAEDKPLSAEVILDIVLQLISAPENEGALCIIDSTSALIPSKDLDEDVTGSMRPGLPKILSNFVKKAGQIVPNNKVVMLMITHLITNTSGYGAGMAPDCGVKIQFQADTRMQVKSIAPWLEDKIQIGQAVNWKIYYSSKGATAIECTSWIRYGKGIDKIQELIALGDELGLIYKSGAWCTCLFLKEDPSFLQMFPGEDPEKFTKLNGQEKLYKFLLENPNVLKMLNSKIKEMLE